MSASKSYTFLSAGLVGISLASLLGLRSTSFAATDVVDNVSLTVPAACSLESVVNTPHSATINSGTYRADIGTTTFKVLCNDDNGYSVYAVGYSGEEYGNTNMISPLASFTTSTATSGDTSAWAMKLTPVAGTYAPTILNSFDAYHAVPATYTKVATFASATDDSTGSSFTSTYAVYISGGQSAGTYNGKVKFTMVHPASETPVEPITCGAGKICYAPNAKGIADSIGDQSVSSNSEVTLWANNFKREGYGFAGWTDSWGGDGNKYGPNETITTGDLSSNGLALYPIWVKSEGNMQGWNNCYELNVGSVIALTDNRDGNTYAIAKLADGECWMIENLRLGGTSTTALTPANSNIVNNFTLSASTNPTTTAWCEDWNATCIDQSMLNSDNTTNSVASMTTPDTNIYGYGNYYNWYSATAGSRSYNDGAGNAPSSICPIGWNLPKGYQDDTDYGDFYRMVSAISGKTLNLGSTYYWDSSDPDSLAVISAIKSYPNNFVSSGDAWGSSVEGRGANGVFWSSTADSWSSTADGSGIARELVFGPDNVGPGSFLSRNKYYGVTVRCFAGS